MRREQRPQAHLKRVDARQLADLRNNPAVQPCVPLFDRFSRSKPDIYLASYSFGSKIIDWPQGTGAAAVFHPPCFQKDKCCNDCREVRSACSGTMPLVMLLKNRAELFQDTTTFAGVTGQASSVPMEILSPGRILGLADLFCKNVLDATETGMLAQKSTLRVVAGARSIAFGMPLGDQELGLRLLGFLKGEYIDSLPEQFDFEQDHWMFAKNVIKANYSTDYSETPWQVEALIIPQDVLRDIFKQRPEIENFLLRLALAEKQKHFQAAAQTRHIAEIVYSSNLTVEAKAHFSELLQIITGNRLGVAPVSDDILGPFTAVQKFLANSGIMSSPTLQNRIPCILIPKPFHQSAQSPDFIYYSLHKPMTQLQQAPPIRPIRVMEALAAALNKLINNKAISKLAVEFFTSETQPKSSIHIQGVAGNERLLTDFAQQIDISKPKGMQRELALGNPRSGFLKYLIRLGANARKDPMTKNREIQSVA